MRLVLKWLLSAVALLAVAYVYSGVQVNNFVSALIAAAVIGLLNAVLRPVLVILTLPVSIVTLGLFLFVDDAAYARDQLRLHVPANPAPAGSVHWILVACAPRMTHRISKWVSHSARENWRA